MSVPNLNEVIARLTRHIAERNCEAAGLHFHELSEEEQAGALIIACEGAGVEFSGIKHLVLHTRLVDERTH